jgi:hypothetical protein
MKTGCTERLQRVITRDAIRRGIKELQERIEKTETTPEGKQCPHCKKKRRSKTRKKKR